MTRRDRNAETTRHDILVAAREIFSQHPYSEVSGTQICDHAGVTRGAMQHHFGSKLGVFTAVFEDLQHRVYQRTLDALSQQKQPWDRVRIGLTAFLDACTQPAYQTVVLKEGPTAIGWGRYRELDTEYYGNLARGFAAFLTPAGSGRYTSAMLVASMRGALAELSFAIARSGDRELARQEALIVVEKLLHSFRDQPPNRPIRVGVAELRAATSVYLERAAAGQVIDVTRCGRVIARLQQPTS